MTEPDRALARRLAQESLDKGDAVGWFDALYDAAQGDASVVPWADLRVNPNLAAWLAQRPAGPLGRALVVGCGLGDDAEELARRGCACHRVRRRAAGHRVVPPALSRYTSRLPRGGRVAAAARLAWSIRFRGRNLHACKSCRLNCAAAVIENIAGCIAPGGSLLIVARARDADGDRGAMPWPLTKDELAQFGAHGLETITFEDYLDDETPPVRRFRVALSTASVIGSLSESGAFAAQQPVEETRDATLTDAPPIRNIARGERLARAVSPSCLSVFPACLASLERRISRRKFSENFPRGSRFASDSTNRAHRPAISRPECLPTAWQIDYPIRRGITRPNASAASRWENC